jgi:hypothetical protein
LSALSETRALPSSVHAHAERAAQHDANTQTAVEEHEASIQSAMAEIKVLVRRIAFALNVLRRGE